MRHRATKSVAYVAAALVVILALAACEDDPASVTTKDTLSDPLGDVAALNGYLFATNEDRSGHAGSQVDLFQFNADGVAEEQFDLALNGVGYLAACSDGEWLYLQSRGTGRLFKVSPVGEIAWVRSDPFAGAGKLACGIAYRADVDSFVVIYRNPGTTAYTTRQHGPDFAGEASPPVTNDWTLFDPAAGILAVTWLDGWLWALGLDQVGQAVVQGLRDDGSATRFLTLDDATACGLTVLDDELIAAYPDRRFEAVIDEE